MPDSRKGDQSVVLLSCSFGEDGKPEVLRKDKRIRISSRP
jgi:hypothetical protein